jgi:anti-anti-sigma regulatory factor
MIIQTRGDVIILKGALTENQWPAIRSAVSLLLESYPSGVVIDASALTEVTEAGARTFLDASNFIQAHNARVVVSGLPDDILVEIRKIPGIRSQLVVAESVDEARASLESGGSAATAGKPGPRVLVPLIGAWEKAIHFAAIEAASRKAELHLIYVLVIPRNQPLGVPVPEQEHEAQHVLTEAESMLRRSRVKVRKTTIRARDAVEGAAKYAADTKPDLLAVAYYKTDMVKGGTNSSAMDILCHEVPGDVALYCVSP